MPDSTPTSPGAPSNGGVWALGWKLLGLSPEQQRGFIAIALTVFLMWVVYDSVKEGRKSDSDRTALVIRAFESEGEKGRQAVAEVGKITVASHQALAVSVGKLEQRVADLNASATELKRELSELKAVIVELKKKVPPSEIDAAPAPRLKAVMVAG